MNLAIVNNLEWGYDLMEHKMLLTIRDCMRKLCSDTFFTFFFFNWAVLLLNGTLLVFDQF